MSIKRIEISIKDKKRFGLVAFLVDRPDFLALIEQIRENLRLKKLPYTFINYPFSYKEANNVVNYYQKGVCSIYDVYSCFKDICEAKSLDIAELDYTLALAFEYAEIIIKKQEKTRVYLPIVLASLLVGSIRDSDLLPTNTLELDNKSIHEFQNELGEGEKILAIMVNRKSTWEEIKEVFNYLQRYRLGTVKIKNKEEDAFYKIYSDELITEDLPNTRWTIETVRDWYWRNQEKESPLKIAIRENKGEEYYKEATEALKHNKRLSDDKATEYLDYLEKIENYEDKVEKAISRYKEILTRHLPST